MSKMCVEFTDDTDRTLEGLAAQLGTSKAGVLRFGIALMGLAVREQREGNALGIVRGGQVMREVVGLWTVPAQEVRA